jgi:hypothetical protein
MSDCPPTGGKSARILRRGGQVGSAVATPLVELNDETIDTLRRWFGNMQADDRVAKSSGWLRSRAALMPSATADLRAGRVVHRQEAVQRPS